MARRVVVHVGLMKSGTTFLQGRMAANRRRLDRQGVLFPGPGWRRHVNAVQDLLGFPGHTPGSWDSLVREINDYPGTAVISMEYLVIAGVPGRTAVRDSFGDAEVRAVLGVRDLGRTVPAMWQEAVKNRSTLSFAEYVEGVRTRTEQGRRFWRQQNAGRVAARWAQELGPQNVHVVTLPPPGSRGGVLWRRFSEVAGIREEPRWDEAPRTNESLGAASTTVVRRLNGLTGDLSVMAYKRRVKALGKLVLPGHRAAEDPIGFKVPRWLREESARVRQEIADSGAQVVGDLAELDPVDVPGVDPDRVGLEAQLDAALAALDGTLRQAKGLWAPD
jgi:hypothetical protein